jgi:hypothetical protein
MGERASVLRELLLELLRGIRGPTMCLALVFAIAVGSTKKLMVRDFVI